jgi:hypothetical protein
VLSFGFLKSWALIFSMKYPTIKLPGIRQQIFSKALYKGYENLESPIF